MILVIIQMESGVMPLRPASTPRMNPSGRHPIRTGRPVRMPRKNSDAVEGFEGVMDSDEEGVGGVDAGGAW